MALNPSNGSNLKQLALKGLMEARGQTQSSQDDIDYHSRHVDATSCLSAQRITVSNLSHYLHYQQLLPPRRRLDCFSQKTDLAQHLFSEPSELWQCSESCQCGVCDGSSVMQGRNFWLKSGGPKIFALSLSGSEVYAGIDGWVFLHSFPLLFPSSPTLFSLCLLLSFSSLRSSAPKTRYEVCGAL